MGRLWEDGGYSAEIRIELLCNGRRYDVAEIGVDTMMLRNADELPNGYAQLIVEIDGDRSVRDIFVTCENRELAELSFA
ncbi:hypothetical protein [Botrimarina sp.]|uniref:hypothetical protein n=1 Tax=Botrimarina sp. TaxID=2795802 RepID=UPI0032EBAE3B